MQRWSPAFVGIGSNLDEPVSQVRRAFSALGELPDSRLYARSRLYRSVPLGPRGQPDYVNAVAGLLTCLAPGALLECCQRIERAQGRVRAGPRWGPRTIDLDLLLYASRETSSPALTLPHPGLTRRNFVVYPLADIAPELVLPDGLPLAALRERLGHEGLERLAERETV